LNRAAEARTGYSLQEVKHRHFWELFGPREELEAIQGTFERMVAGMFPTQYETGWVMRDGSHRIIAWSGTAVLDENGDVEQIINTGIDVTEFRKAEAMVADQENLRIYANLVTETQERERKYLAGELHDETVQSLARLGLDIDRAINAKGKLPKETADQLEELRAQADEILRGVRRFSQALRPPMLEDLGLLDALRWLADSSTGKDDPIVSVQLHGEPRRLPPEKELVLFRIAQEALNNVRKHAQATEATIRVDFGAEGMTMSISDDGQGFKLPKGVANYARLGKMGLMGMQERVGLLGGTFNIRSGAKAGTTVSVTLANEQSNHTDPTGEIHAPDQPQE
jgi:PAS domain S-box-containing protein